MLAKGLLSLQSIALFFTITLAQGKP